MSNFTNIGPKSFYDNFVSEVVNVAPLLSRSSFSLFLNSQQRSTFLNVCQKIRSMACYSSFNPHEFLQELQHQSLYLSLEELWILHFSQILPLDIFLSNLESKRLTEFKKSILEMCFFCTKEDKAKEFVQIGILSYFVRNAIDNCDDASKEISNCILKSYIEDIFTHESDEQQNNKRAQLLYSIFYCGTLERTTLHTFSVNILTFFAKMSSDSICEALAVQENCYKNESPFHAYSILQKILQHMELHSVENLIFEELLTETTNWKNLVVLIHAFIKTYGPAFSIVSKHVGEVLKKSLQTFDTSNFQKAMLIGRQSILASNPANSYPGVYKQWIITQIGDLQLLKNPQICHFFLQGLSEMIPHEINVEILKVGLERIFPVPMECQDSYMDYKVLLKTRINDLEPRTQPEEVIDKLLAVYEQSGKIPSYVLEVSLVRKHYFLNEFLPVLLAPRVVPTVPDLRSKFIDDLDKAGKIPPQMLQKYKAMCNQLKQSHLSGR